MTGIEVKISQEIPLSNRFFHREQELLKRSQSHDWLAKKQFDDLLRSFWNYLVIANRLQQEIIILTENHSWISQIIEVSQNLYSTGKQTQQALLDLKIRKSEIRNLISDKEFKLKETLSSMSYLIGDDSFEFSTIPWSLLKKKSQETDKKQKSLEAELEAKEHLMRAKELMKIPDLQMS